MSLSRRRRRSERRDDPWRLRRRPPCERLIPLLVQSAHHLDPSEIATRPRQVGFGDRRARRGRRRRFFRGDPWRQRRAEGLPEARKVMIRHRPAHVDDLRRQTGPEDCAQRLDARNIGCVEQFHDDTPARPSSNGNADQRTDAHAHRIRHAIRIRGIEMCDALADEDDVGEAAAQCVTGATSVRRRGRCAPT